MVQDALANHKIKNSCCEFKLVSTAFSEYNAFCASPFCDFAREADIANTRVYTDAMRTETHSTKRECSAATTHVQTAHTLKPTASGKYPQSSGNTLAKAAKALLVKMPP